MPRTGRRSPEDDPDNPPMDFRDECRNNATHASTTAPEVRLAFLGHALMENRHGLLMDFTVSDFTVSQTTGTSERDTVPKLLDGVREHGYHPRTLGADRGYDTQNCVRDIWAQRVTPHVAQKQHSAIDDRTTRHAGYTVSLRIRKRVEEIFGWMKTVGGLRRTSHRDVERTGLASYLVVMFQPPSQDGPAGREQPGHRGLTRLQVAPCPDDTHGPIH